MLQLKEIIIDNVIINCEFIKSKKIINNNKKWGVKLMTAESILDIKSSGERFEGYALIKSTQSAIARNGSPYFTIIIGEKNKIISCKLWENQFNNYTVSELTNEFFVVGSIMYMEGTVGEYRGELQMTISNYRRTEDGEVDITEYLESAPEPLEQMQEEFEGFLEAIHSEILKEICKDVYNEHQSAFITHPAAKAFHHSFRSGLLYHTLSMLRLAKGICSQYQQINRDIVYAAIALHDLGKVVELTDFLAPDYTKVGNLLGHITIVNMFIDRKAQKMKEETDRWTRADFEQVYELMHVISAHHGKLEYGSPVEPKILEAEVVHQIDMLDSRINMITDGLADDSLAIDEPKQIYPLGLFYKTITPSN